MSRFYLVLTVLGIAAPYAAFLPWLFTNGLNLPLLFEQAIVNPISAMAWLDVVVAAVALIGFILVDGKQNHVKGRFVAILGTLSAGVSFGLPLYLYLKHK